MFQNSDIRSSPSSGKMRFASFSSNFSPGSVDTMPSRSMRDRVTFLTGSIMRISALKVAKTFDDRMRGGIERLIIGLHDEPGLWSDPRNSALE